MAIVKTPQTMTSGHLAQFRQDLGEALDTGDDAIVVDLQQTKYISSGALRQLFKAYQIAKGTGQRIRLRNVSEQIADLIQVTGFVQIFHVETQARTSPS